MQNRFYTSLIQLMVVLMLFSPLLGYAKSGYPEADSYALSVHNVDQDTPPVSSAAAVPKRAAFVAKPPSRGLPTAEGRFIIKSERPVLVQIRPSGELEIKSDDDVDDHHSSSSGKIIGDVGSAVDPDQNSNISPRRILESIDPNSAYERVTPASSPPPPSTSSPKKKQKSPAKISVAPKEGMGSGVGSAAPKKKFVPKVLPRTLNKPQGQIEIGHSSTSFGTGDNQTAATKESAAFAERIVQDDVEATVVVAPPPSLPLQVDDVSTTGKATAVKRQFTKKAAVKTLAKPVYVESLPSSAAKISVVQRVISDGVQITLNVPLVASQNKVLAVETGVIEAIITDGLESDIITPDLAIFDKDITHDAQIVLPQITQSLGVDTSISGINMEEKIIDINDENITPSISEGRVLARDISQVLLVQPKEIVPVVNVAIPQIRNGARFEFDLAESLLQPKELVLNSVIVGLQRISDGRVANQELLHLQMMQKVVLATNTQIIPPFVAGGRSISVTLPDISIRTKVIEQVTGALDASLISSGNEIVRDLFSVEMDQQDVVASEDIILPVIAQGEEASASISMAIIPKPIPLATDVLTPLVTQGLRVIIDSPVLQISVKEVTQTRDVRTPLIGQGQAFGFEIPQVLIHEKAITPIDNLSQSKIPQGSLAIMDLPKLRLSREIHSHEAQVVVSNIKVGNKIEIEAQLPDTQMQKKKLNVDSRVIMPLVPGGVNVGAILPDAPMRPKGREPVMNIVASLISQGKELTSETMPVIGPQKKIEAIAEVNIPMIERRAEIDNHVPDLVMARKAIFHSENIALSRIIRGGEAFTSSTRVPMVLKNPISFLGTTVAPISSGKEIDIGIHDPLIIGKKVVANAVTITPRVDRGDEVDVDITDIPMLSKRGEPVTGIVVPLIEEGNEFADDLPPIRMNRKDVVANNSVILPIIVPGLEADESQPIAHINDKHIASEVMVISPSISLGNRLDTNIDSIPAKLHVTEGDTTVLMPIESSVSDSQYDSYSTSQWSDITTDSKEEYITEEQSYSMSDQLLLSNDQVVLGGGDKFVATISVSEITKTVADYVKQGMHYAISSFETINAIISARLDIFKSELTVGVAAGDENSVVEKGVWSKIFTSKTTQDNSIGKAEFNNNQKGFIIGFDAELKDENVFGVAVTKSDSKTNFFSSVDNSQKSDLYSVILYNEMSLTDKLYLNTNLKYGKAYVKHKIHTAIPLSGKTTADIFSASIDSVYKHKSANGTLISPILRFTFSNFFIDDFSEINDEIKVYIPHKRARVLLAQGGMGFKRAIAVGKSKLEIEFHGGIETILALRQSNDMITIVSDVSEHIQGKFVHPTKTRYNFGANLAIVTDMGLRAGIAADHIFANRYRSSGAFLFLVYHF